MLENKTKIGLIALTIALFTSAFLIGFNAGINYYRTANLNVEVESGYCAHIIVWLEKADGTKILIKDGVALNNAGVLTNQGKDFIEGKLGDPSYGSNDKFVVYIAVSNDTSSPDADWTAIPDEINSGGLQRAQGTYQSTGTGQWQISVQFTASASFINVQLTGLYWDASGNTLFASDTFAPVSLNANDKLTITWVITVS